MIIIKDKAMCSGCTACMQICPSQAITMTPDMEGFCYPEVNSGRCNDCGTCTKLCPFQNKQGIDKLLQPPIVYAVKHKNEQIRYSSSSGGMFTAISDYIIDNAGVIYGAAFDDNFRVVHQKAESAVGRNKFRGSKYVQSDLGNIFLDVKKNWKKIGLFCLRAHHVK